MACVILPVPVRTAFPTFLLLSAAFAGCDSSSEPAPKDPTPDASMPDAAVDAEIDPPGLPLATLRCDAVPACVAVDATVTAFTSAADLESHFVGGWRHCGDASGLFHAGIEVAPNHKLYVLEAAPDGSCRRASGGGTWEPLDVSEQNPPGTYQVTIHWFEGTFSFVFPKFNTSGSGLRFDFPDHQFNQLQPL